MFRIVLPGVASTTKEGNRERRDFYVYVHRDQRGSIFYVGKGKGDRAWSTDRHPIWHRYVETRLGGHYSVEIIEKNLTEPRRRSARAS